MATLTQWIEGARPRTLPNAIAPVLAGTGAAAFSAEPNWTRAGLALLVSLALIVGVNYANDYSDGIRGTDDNRVGPMRLVGSGAAQANSVKVAAIMALTIAAGAGIALALLSAWWLILVGAGCLIGAWFYTGGSKPYGYLGFGEIAVFLFFGLVAVLGTEFVQISTIDWVGLCCAIAVGSFSSAVLLVNNLRDIPTDSTSGKMTLAVRLGAEKTRIFYYFLVTAPVAITVALASCATAWSLLGLLSLPLILLATKPIQRKSVGTKLIPTLAITGLAMLTWAGGTTLGLFLN